MEFIGGLFAFLMVAWFLACAVGLIGRGIGDFFNGTSSHEANKAILEAMEAMEANSAEDDEAEHQLNQVISRDAELGKIPHVKCGLRRLRGQITN